MASRIHILGGGALGCLLGHELRRQGIPVTILLREATETTGTITLANAITKMSGQETVDLESSASVSGSIDRLIVTAKAFDIKPALHGLRGRLSRQSGVILVHNGMLTEPLSELAPFIDPGNVHFGVTLHAGFVTRRFPAACTTWAAPGHLTLAPMVEGSPSTPAKELLDSLVACKSLEAVVVGHREGQIAQRLKLALNAGSNPITGLMNMTNGEVSAQPAFRETTRALCVESARVFEAERLAQTPVLPAEARLDAEALEEAVMRGLTVTGANFSSTLMDIRNGRQPEIPYINGAIAALGRRYGVPTPSHDLVTALVKLRAQLGNSAYRF